MGVKQSTFADIENKYGPQAADYIAQKRTERIFLERTKDELQRINDYVNLQESEDIEWISQEKRNLQTHFEKIVAEANQSKKNLIAESQAKHKKNVSEFSGYNAEVKRLEELEKKVRQQYKIEREKVRNKIDQEIKKGVPIGALKSVAEFDSKPESVRKSIEEECFKKYPAKLVNVDTVAVERELRWDNFKADFLAILKKDQESVNTQKFRDQIKENILPASAPVCC